MKAVQFKFGGDHSIVKVPSPTPRSDEVLVKVQYSALDTSHEAVLNKTIPGYFIHTLKEPLYLGYHYCGTVEEIGADVDTTSDTGLTKGSEVFGFLQCVPSQTQGAFAEYITVKATDCAVKPAGVSGQIAAASATEAITALQAIFNLGGLDKGQHILIVGAGGGVGSAAVQIAKQLGATVTAVCSTKDVDRVQQQWGADTVVDRTVDPQYTTTLLQEGVRFDVILDACNALPASATKLLKPKGAIVNTIPTFTFMWNKIKTLISSKRVYFVECHSTKSDLDLIGKWLDEGHLDIPIDSTFKVRDMQSAMAKHAGRKTGRVSIQVEDAW